MRTGRRVSDRWIPSKFPERTRTVRSDRSYKGDIPSGKAKVKSRLDLDRLLVWTHGSQEGSSAIRGSGL
jgi:hypothetical protein